MMIMIVMIIKTMFMLPSSCTGNCVSTAGCNCTSQSTGLDRSSEHVGFLENDVNIAIQMASKLD